MHPEASDVEDVVERAAGPTQASGAIMAFSGGLDSTQALMGGHVMAQSDATGWDKYVDGGQMRLLVTFGENRTKRWPTVPTAKELGYGVVSSSPYGIVGPKGMDPAVVKTLHDAFRKAIVLDPKSIEAPVNLAYSQRNRSAACRIPMYSPSPKAKRIEFRCPDPSSNPYLTFSAIMMAASKHSQAPQAISWSRNS